MKKEDVQLHGTGYGGDALPAVDVKVCHVIEDVDWSTLDIADADRATFTAEWCAANLADDVELFAFTCELGFEQMQTDAEEIFGAGVKVYAEGRSGGWAVVSGLPDVETWDAIQLGKWARFSKYARGYADDAMYQLVMLAYLNVYLPQREQMGKEALANVARMV